MVALIRGHGPHRGAMPGAIDTPNGVFWWVAPSYPEIVNSRIWVNLKRALQQATAEKNEVEKTITLTNGAIVAVRSADQPDTLRGPGIDGLVIDEAAIVKEYAWSEVLRPALADKQGWAMFCFTPRGRNWVYGLWNKTVAGWQSWQLPTSENPLVLTAEIEAIKQELGPRKFAQEFLAQFTDIEGAMWPGEYFGDHLWATTWPEAIEMSAMAVDPSMGKQTKAGDFAAIVYAGLAGGKFWIDAHMERATPLRIVDATLRLAARHRPDVVGVESNGFQAVLGDLFDSECATRGAPPLPLAMVNNTEKKEHRIQRLDPRLANRQLVFAQNEHCERLVEQLQMFPQHDHDDGPDALEMALRLLAWQASRRGIVDDDQSVTEFARA